MKTRKHCSKKNIRVNRLSCILILISFLSGVPLFGQYNDWEAGEQATPLTTFDRYYQDAVEAVGAGNLGAAEEYLETARQEATIRKDKVGKQKARDALRRVRSFYRPLYDHLAQGEEQIRKGAWKAAQEELELARQLVEKNRDADLKELEPVDRRLGSRVDEALRRAEHQRLLLVQDHFRVAEQSLQAGAYEGVLAEMEATRSLLFEEREARELERVQALENRARYQQLMEAGQQAADNEDFQAALAAYREAEGVMDSYEVQEKRKEMEGRLHYNLLRQGQEAYLGRRYEEAARILAEAASLQSSSTHQRIVQSAYAELKAEGDKAMEQKKYNTAEQWFRYAQLFADSPGIQEDILRAESAMEYDDQYVKALASIDEGKLKRARRQLRRAIRKAPREEARQLIAEIDAYYEKIKSGKQLLDEAPAEAWQHFKEAEQLFATDEIEQWIYKAREAAGGNVGEVDPADFYN